MINVVTWKWGTLFGPEYVNRLARMLQRHLHMPYRFNVITDNVIGIDDSLAMRIVPMFTEHMDMTTGHRACFHRLKILSREMLPIFGPRILQLDLDAVFTGDLTPLFDRPDPLVLVEQNAAGRRVTYNPSMLLMDTGILHPVWEKFNADPRQTWYTAKSHGWIGSDMSIINDYLDQHSAVERAVWKPADGVISYWREIMGQRVPGTLPENTRAVLFYGSQNPTDADVLERSPWIADHWV